MKDIYKNNDTIVLFLNKAQNKIANLATQLVDRGGEISDSLLLLLELSDFIEELDSQYCNYNEDDILRWIHEYNYRAELNAIPYLNIVGYSTYILGNSNGGGSSGIITTGDIIDYVSTTYNLISKFPHNELSGLQGGTINERYHITKKMYDYLVSIVNPTASTSVSLQLATNGYRWPSGYFEIGSSVGVVSLIGSIDYGLTSNATYYEYLKGTTSLGKVNNPTPNSQPNSLLDTAGISTDTTYTFRASMSDGLKTATSSLLFRQPMYYGVIKRSNIGNATAMIAGTKDVRDKGMMDLTFIVPAGNTLLAKQDSLTQYLFVSASWGKFSMATVGIFDFTADWIPVPYAMKLADGTTLPGLLIYYNTQTEGTTTFKFNW